MRGLFRLATCLLGLLSSVVAKSSTGNSVLVVVDPENRDLYTTFFNGLESQGYQLTFRAPKDEAPLIIQDDYPTFAHIVYFAPDTKSASYFRAQHRTPTDHISLAPAKDITPQTLVELAKQHYLMDRERGCADPLYVAEELGQLKSAEFSDCPACARDLEAWAAKERERLWKAIPDWFRLR